MPTKTELQKYAELIIETGINLQKGQRAVISSPVETREFALILQECAYKHGASKAEIRYYDDKSARIDYEYAKTEILSEVPRYLVESKNYILEHGCAYIAIDADDPNIFKKIPPEKLLAAARAKGKAYKKFSDAMMKNAVSWCVAAYPTKEWAKQVFKSGNSVERLWQAISATLRLSDANPAKSWEKHIVTLEKRAEFLNEKNFEYLHYTASNGTDARVGLAEQHVWRSARETNANGVGFVANMPTEEIYTCPHRLKTDGIVFGALPLVNNGKIIDGFYLKFRNGKIIDYGAKQGLDALKNIIETDNGTKYLGEVALIGKNSPVSKQNILFYNTLFDENASCHLAIGKGYPSTVQNGEKLKKNQLTALGVNDSVEHCDLMIGTPDLHVEGITYDGERTILMNDGEWVI